MVAAEDLCRNNLGMFHPLNLDSAWVTSCGSAEVGPVLFLLQCIVQPRDAHGLRSSKPLSARSRDSLTSSAQSRFHTE
jgi:hypothetical protein